DPVLQNAWGVAFSPAGSPFWVADNATGCSTLYDGTGLKNQNLQVSIPLPGGSVPPTACKTVNPNSPPNPTPAAPTGIIWNPSTALVVPNSVSTANPKGIPASSFLTLRMERFPPGPWASIPPPMRSSPLTTLQAAPSTRASLTASTCMVFSSLRPTLMPGRSTCSG